MYGTSDEPCGTACGGQEVRTLKNGECSKVNNALALHEVFKLSGIPTYTFVKPEEYPRLLMALKTPGRGIVVEGPSGIGKTTAITKVLEEVGITEKVVKLSARKADDVSLIRELPKIQPLGTVVIDDFHKLPDTKKKLIADLMKILADESAVGSKVIAIGINRAGEALIDFADDLTNRLEIIPFETNPDKRVAEVLRLGEQALNIEINIRDEIIDAAHGSFYLAQMLAYHTCLDAGVEETQASKAPTTISFPGVKARVFETLAKRFQQRTQEFAKGTRLRREGRAPYLHLLYWLGTSDEWTLSLNKAQVRYPDFKGSLTQIIEKNIWSTRCVLFLKWRRLFTMSLAITCSQSKTLSSFFTFEIFHGIGLRKMWDTLGLTFLTDTISRFPLQAVIALLRNRSS
jgi:hypothetical protein